MIDAKLLCKHGNLRTYELLFPHVILPQVLTHRVFSRNTSSARAEPTRHLSERLQHSRYTPTEWGRNRAGMQSTEALSPLRQALAKFAWSSTFHLCRLSSSLLNKTGVHKQWANRLVEPWMLTSMVLTGTEFDNFFELRDHKDAQPEIQTLARRMREEGDLAILPDNPIVEFEGVTVTLPYTTHEERSNIDNRFDLLRLCCLSTARCARVSYLQNGDSDIGRDLNLCQKLFINQPKHLSPTEHICFKGKSSANLIGWTPFRKFVDTFESNTLTSNDWLANATESGAFETFLKECKA